ncbi:MAG: glycosyltransferase family 39 protein [Candidatus Melainabacteria bacterium]|nr:glycosyltransferase family 39 protein [Candidatus Melainabacteria bacterium]
MPDTPVDNEILPNCANKWSRADRIALLVVCFASALIVLPGLNSFGIIDPSDGLYSEGAREMLEMKNFITPQYNYIPFYEKPIMIYWMMIASYSVFGVHEWVARLPSALCAIATTGVVFSMSRYFVSLRVALYSSIVLTTSPLFAIVGMLALTDMPLCCFLTTAMLIFIRRLNGERSPILWLGYASLGLAVLTKGPLPIALTAMVFTAYLIASSGANLKNPAWYWRQILQLEPFKGMALTLALALPWFVAETMVTHGDFFQEFFVRQNLGRLGGLVNHVMPFWFYFPVIILGTSPWIIFQWLAPRLTINLLTKRSISFPADALTLFCFCWSVVVFVFLSIVKTKLATYILPVVPPIAIIVGQYFERWSVDKTHKSLLVAGIAIAALLFIGAGVLPIASESLPEKLKDGYIAPLVLGALSLAVGWEVFSFKVWQNKIESAVQSVLCCSVVGVALIIPTAISVFDIEQDQPLRQLINRARNENVRLSTFTRTCTAAPFYMKESVPMITNEQEYQTFIHDSNKQHWILASKDVVALLLVHPGEIKLIEQKGKWSLFSLK